MTTSIDDQWKDLCEEHDRARDAIAEVMSDRRSGVYQDSDFWQRLTTAQTRQKAVEKKMSDFREANSGA
ncbi:hypothetical protein R54767_04694 [Paraburkholderia gardini]|uniref:Uncharacterized protein n=2 Tax=Paraburkholderia gardini TaxID=2823469 RepID=A0ABN7QQQ5_9BURK|nr:hypothetical protein R54767_04694 [Paraburkholderia gardini]